jgi:hypothetical protein
VIFDNFYNYIQSLKTKNNKKMRKRGKTSPFKRPKRKEEWFRLGGSKEKRRRKVIKRRKEKKKETNTIK